MSALARRPGPAGLKWGLALGALGLLGAASMTALAPTAPHEHGLHMAGAQPSATALAGRPATASRPIACEKLPHVPGQTITTGLVPFPPNGFSPRHRHAGSVMVYVLNGAVRSQLNDGPVETFTPGQSFFEPPGAIHSFAENASTTEPAEILATFVADDCAVLTTYED
jgi:quercetin dioxygenase-like cupin family protein